MLVMDIGNTHTRLVHFTGDRIDAGRKLSTPNLEPDMVAAALVATREDEETIWIASVARQQNATVAAAAERVGMRYAFIVPARDFVMPHALETPETTGADRLLTALAAQTLLYPGRGGFLTVQCGSAVTVDWVDREGRFRGGYILPGPRMWLAGLARAAQLPDLSSDEVDWHSDGPGASTRDSMLQGLAAGLPAAITAAVECLLREPDLGLDCGRPPVALTGGWAGAVRNRLGVAADLEPELLLHGIRLFAEREANIHSGESQP